MKSKLKILKHSIDTHYPDLIKKYPVTKMIASAIDKIFEIDMEDEEHWYRSVRFFLRDIEREIKRLESGEI